ncbi:type II toxin-antitoxin system VapC family toxin [Limnovirga soli]|uniref:Ribonuclease VapC n=1 Tax=Limnovirga soli TaxID=2656915 RepID=A0A8J8F9T4_9BACT|nr:type II toxin-antitoxin system VapC family toxin [Limnovirga soli]NNV53966.1 PIN domain-containing protein [Limnovirga soli]
MNGNSLLLDTNAVLYVLAGDETLAAFLNGKDLYLSIISELELLSYKKLTQKETKAITSFLKELKIEGISEEIKHITINIRKATSLKLPDCIIAATSKALSIPLVTSDKQLGAVEGLDVILYER